MCTQNHIYLFFIITIIIIIIIIIIIKFICTVE